LDPEKVGPMGPNYAQDNKHMRKMETQAYLIGNMCFRDFEDGLDYEDKKLYKLAESKFLKENKTMTTKITKEYLKETIEKILEQRISEKTGQQTTAGPSGAIFLSADEKARVQKIGDEQGEGAARRALRKIAMSRNDGKRIDAETMVVNDLMKKLNTSTFKKEKGTAVAPVRKESVNVDIEKSELEENEELEEKRGKKKSGLKNPKKADLNKDGKLSKYEKRRGKAIEKAMAAEQVNTPESEIHLYEERFTPRNTRLFEKLLNEWTK
jgi:hypothetical protein